jgi:hypothetical protein
MEGTDSEVTATINIALFCTAPITSIVQPTVTPPNFSPALSLQSKMDL